MDDQRQAFIRAIIANPDSNLERLIYADFLDEYGGSVPCRRCRGSGRADPGKDGEDGRDPCRDCGGGGSVPDADRARAEFIRVECDLALIERDGCSVVCSQECGHRQGCKTQQILALRDRERELLRLHEGEWLPPPVFDAACWGIVPDFTEHRRWRWSRGFVTTVTASWSLWLAHHKAILESCPIVNSKDGLIRLATLPPAGDWVTATPYLVWLEAEFPGVRFALPDDAPHGTVTRPVPAVSRRSPLA